MKGLYKGKYIIAVYDKNCFLTDVACYPTELRCVQDKSISLSTISRIANGQMVRNDILLIDVTEKYDDAFAEEDQYFLDFVESTRKKTNEEKANDLNMNVRTYYRHKHSFEPKRNDIMIK